MVSNQLLKGREYPNMNRFRRIIAAALTAAALLTAASCGVSPHVVDGVVDHPYAAYDLSKYITLPELTGNTFVMDPITVTSEDVDNAIASVLYAHMGYEDDYESAVKSGDIVCITFTTDGIDDAKLTDYNLTVGGESYFPPELGAALIGHKSGDKVSVSVTYPADYNAMLAEQLAGKTVTHQVAVNYIMVLNVPELTDEFVASVSDAKTVSEYRELKMRELLDAQQNNLISREQNEIWQKAVDESVILGYPEEKYNEFRDLYIRAYNESMPSIYGDDQATLAADAENYAQESVKGDLMLYAAAEKYNITLSESEYYAMLAEIYEQYKNQYGTVSEFVAAYGEDYVRGNCIFKKLMDYLLANNEFIVPEE